MPARKVLVLLAGALTLVGLTSAITYAATTTSGAVSACSSTHGRLALQTSKGKCPRGFHKVTLNERGPAGPRGVTGKTGKTGARGPAGPGAVEFFAQTTSTLNPAEARAVTFSKAGVRIGASCLANGEAHLFIIDPTGVGGAISFNGSLLLQQQNAAPTTGGAVSVDGSPQATLTEGMHMFGTAFAAQQNSEADIAVSGGYGEMQFVVERGGHLLTVQGTVIESQAVCRLAVQAVPSA